jgi:hypothetical protein
MSETETTTGHTQPAPAPLQEVSNPPYVVPYGHADAPPPVPPEPVQDPETQAYLDAHQAAQDPREPGAPPMTADEYHEAFAKPPDPRDTGTETPAPGDLIPPVPGAAADAGPQAPPVNIDVPHLSQDGAILVCTMGNWEGEPDQYAYLWVADGLEVGNGLNEYTLVSDDVGRDYVCAVTATNAAGSTTAPLSNNVTVVDFAAREAETETDGEPKPKRSHHRAKEAD